jgi:hypothetical protein
MPSENPPPALVPKESKALRLPRKRSRALIKPKPVQTAKPDPNAPWVVFWASEDPKLKRVLIGCDRCGCRMSFPNKTPVYRIEAALYGFRLDHQGCEIAKSGTVSLLKGDPKSSAVGDTSKA